MIWVHRLFKLLLFGPVVLWALGLGTVFAIAGWHGCTISEGMVHPCVIGGRDYGQELQFWGVFLGWGLMLLGAYCMCVALLWGVVALLARWRRRAP